MESVPRNDYSISSLTEADAGLAAIGAHKRRISLVENALNEDIAALTHRANASTRTDRVAIKRYEEALQAFSISSKESLFAEKRSQNLPFGVIGFRSSRRLTLLPEWTWERVLAMLQEHNKERCLRVRVDFDKDGMKGLEPAELAQFGCIYDRKEGFYYEVDTRALSDGSRSVN